MSIFIEHDVGEKIRASIDKYRKENNIPVPEEVKKFYNPNQKFLEEELEYVVEIESDAKIMEYIHMFPNLKKIAFKNGESIVKKDIEKLAEICPDLTDLEIEGQKWLQGIDVSKFEKLEVLSIKSNPELKRIDGLNKLMHRDSEKGFLYSFDCYDNIKLMKGSVINVCANLLKAIEEGTKCNLDVLYYPEMKKAIELHNEKIENKISLEYKDFSWTERISQQPDCAGKAPPAYTSTYSSGQMEMADRMADKIIGTYINWKDSQKEKYAILHEWMKRNVKYNYSALTDPNRMDNTKYKLNSNGMMQALKQKTCVCEGYSRTMQYLLRKCAIESEAIGCLTDENKVSKDGYGRESYVPANHSILLVNLDGIDYYSDVTWDADRFQKRDDNSGKYFLLSYQEMSRDRRILDVDGDFRDCQRMSSEERKELMEFAKNRVERGKDETNAHSQRFGKETMNRQNDTKRVDEVFANINRQMRQNYQSRENN